MRPFGYRGLPHTCLYCGRKLRKIYEDVPGTNVFDDWRYRVENDPEYQYDENASCEERETRVKRRDSLLRKMQLSPTYSRWTGDYGYDRNDFFCCGECAKRWANAMAKRGHRIVVREEIDPHESD